MVKRARPSQTDPQYQAPAYHKPFPPREPWNGPTELGRQKSREIREKLKSFLNKRPDKSWAQKILDRHASHGRNWAEQPKPFPIYVLESALEVAALVEREPGSDDE